MYSKPGYHLKQLAYYITLPRLKKALQLLIFTMNGTVASAHDPDWQLGFWKSFDGGVETDDGGRRSCSRGCHRGHVGHGGLTSGLEIEPEIHGS